MTAEVIAGTLPVVTPSKHILVLDGSDGTRVFVCNFCGAQAGPVPKEVPHEAIEIYHSPDCFYTEARRLTAQHIIDRISH